MKIRNLHFFDSNGYNLNFDWNENGYWEGNIYLPKVSVGLYANTSIYVLEKIENANTNSSLFTNEYFFPTGTGKISFTWDRLNKFVDEFFMFNFDESYIIKETSALVYTPNDGPDCNTLIVNRFDTYDVPLDDTLNQKALPIHIAFMANERYDATTYNRTLIMSYNGKTIARIKFYAETVEEDERLKIWNSNLGYNITPEDEMIFFKSDIKEYMPNYITLNEKRKELMMEGSNIYPYIGSYKAIINAIKFFGYDNLNIIEYWRNVNPDDVNFGKIYHSSKYSLTKKETLTIGSRNIVLPNKDYKKINALALVYSINKPTGEVDELELPLVKEQFTYTIEEALIKLFALRKKLNKEFMPGSSRIIDIIGEANYFGIQGITKIHDKSLIQIYDGEMKLDFTVGPTKYLHITDNEYFNRYINVRKIYDGITSDAPLRDQLLSDMSNQNLNEISNEQPYYWGPGPDDRIVETLESLTNNEKCEYYKKYYDDVIVNHKFTKEIGDNDDYPYDNPEYDYTDPYARFTAKVILSNTSFDDVTFENCELKFGCTYHEYDEDSDGNVTLNFEEPVEYEIDEGNDDKSVKFNNIEKLNRPNRIGWKISMSDNQVDEDLKNIGITKIYEKKDLDEIDRQYVFKRFTKINESVTAFNQFFVELPFIGYYDVTMEVYNNVPKIRKNDNDEYNWFIDNEDTGISASWNEAQQNYTNSPTIQNGYWYLGNTNTNIVVKSQKKTKKKCIKVEPYNIDLIGFYYDARELPKNLQYDNPEGSKMYNFIQDCITMMTGFAITERTSELLDTEFTMPTYATDGSIINPGPYYSDNITDEWYLADNITYDITELIPVVEYTRYIRNGVDVKPYTWFLLGYDYSKIAGKINPRWEINNHSTGIVKEYQGMYLTMLLKKEGNYTVTLKLDDKNGNTYEVSRNIIVVSKSANYKIYQSFKKEYDYMEEQNLLKELNDYNELFLSPDLSQS